MNTINADKSVTITIPEYNYDSTFNYDDTNKPLASLTPTLRTAFAAAKEIEIYNLCLSQTKSEKNSQVNTFVQEFMNGIMSSYSPYEQSTFNIQQNEWAAYTANNMAPTPYIDALSLARGITKAAYMVLVGNKVNFFAGIQGKQYAISDRIKAATTKVDVESIPLPILP